jgi:hypothetical protein
VSASGEKQKVSDRFRVPPIAEPTKARLPCGALDVDQVKMNCHTGLRMLEEMERNVIVFGVKKREVHPV